MSDVRLIDADMLARAAGCRADAAARWFPHIEPAMAAFEINTLRRAAAFLGQIGHESGGLRFVRELWGPTPAQTRYEGRKDLGNVKPGDGFRYRGRGLIQVTGRANYVRTRDSLRLYFGSTVPDFEAQPEKLEEPRWAAMSAAMFWKQNGLNALADADESLKITKRINGGTNGLADRDEWHAEAMFALASGGEA